MSGNVSPRIIRPGEINRGVDRRRRDRNGAPRPGRFGPGSSVLDEERGKITEDLSVDRYSILRPVAGYFKVEIAAAINRLTARSCIPANAREVWGKLVARDRYRLSPHDANLRYLLRSSA